MKKYITKCSPLYLAKFHAPCVPCNQSQLTDIGLCRSCDFSDIIKIKRCGMFKNKT